MKKLVLIGILCFYLNFFKVFAQTTGDYRTTVSTFNWNSASEWQTWNGSNWITATTAPVSSNDVYIQAGHTVTLTGNENCNALFISTGTTNASTGGDGQVALSSHTLSVSGKLCCYFGAINVTINSNSALSVTTSATTPALPVSKSSGGLLKFIGNSRNITNSGEWGGTASGSTSLFDIEIALNANQTGTIQSIIKAANWLISSGTVETTFRISPDNNTVGQGDITISDGAILSSSESSASTPVISSTTANRCGTVTINGKIILLGASPYIQCSAFVFGTNGTVEYGRSTSTGNQTFIDASFTGAVTLLNYNHIILSGIGTKTTLASQTTQISANGSLTLSGGALGIGSSATFSVNSTGTSLIYSASSAQTATSTEWNSNFQNITANNAAGISFASLSRTIQGTLSLLSGSVSNSTNISMGNGANIIRSSGALSSTINFGSTVNVTYSQKNSNISTGNELPTNTAVLNNLTINSSNGVTLSAAKTVNGTFTLTTGTLTTTSSNLLTIETTSSSSGGSNSSYINGPVAKNVNSTTTFTFPIGKGNILRTISITPSNSNSTTFTAEYFNTAYSDISSFSSPISKVSTIDYFDLSRSTSGTPSDAIVNIEWGSNSGVNNANVNELTIAQYTGGNWVNQNSSASGNSNSGNVTSTSALSSFGPFILANNNTNNNPLPVKLIYFKGVSLGSIIKLSWASASEINCLGYYLQKSKDGINFIDISLIESKV